MRAGAKLEADALQLFCSEYFLLCHRVRFRFAVRVRARVRVRVTVRVLKPDQVCHRIIP